MGQREKGHLNFVILNIGALIPELALSYVISQQLIAWVTQLITSWHRQRFPVLATAVAVGACRAALKKSSALCRVALAKHRAHIDPDLSKTLEIVGDYEDKVASEFYLVSNVL